MITELLAAIAISVLTIGFTYYLVLIWFGWREARGFSLEFAENAVEAADATNSRGRSTVVFLIPCLDEELVIGATVRNVLADAPGSTIIVIDDASSDRTAEIALAAGNGRVQICQRVLPHARQGKGPALNDGYRLLLEHVKSEGLDPANVIVCVMDADGRLSRGAVAKVLDLFNDATIGGAQLGVRIRNRGTLLTNMQDFEFWGLSALAQLARRRTGSVSLGGNGQFTRLSALEGVSEAPWSRSLTEDLDLAISLQLAGWRLSSVPDAWVSQQGVESLRALVRQRTRWYQGHIQCSRRVGEIWRCLDLPNSTALETAMYLLSPVLLALPWSIIFNLAMIDTWRVHSSEPAFVLFGSELLARVARTGAWYIISFLPALLGGAIYARRERSASLAQAVGYGHLMVLYTYITWYCCWRAVLRIALGRDGWVKTARSTEQPVPARV